MFDRDLVIVQTGTSVARVMPKVTEEGCKVTDILDPVRTRTTDALYEFFALIDLLGMKVAVYIFYLKQCNIKI